MQQKLAHQQLWPLFLAARDAGKKIQFCRARFARMGLRWALFVCSACGWAGPPFPPKLPARLPAVPVGVGGVALAGGRPLPAPRFLRVALAGFPWLLRFTQAYPIGSAPCNSESESVLHCSPLPAVFAGSGCWGWWVQLLRRGLSALLGWPLPFSQDPDYSEVGWTPAL
eukprot:357030-Chlamydomonas_euryale.AAC.4